jgi:hypothetical protein
LGAIALPAAQVLLDGSATFDATDAAKFFKACLEFKDEPVELLYRLTDPQVRARDAALPTVK